MKRRTFDEFSALVWIVLLLFAVAIMSSVIAGDEDEPDGPSFGPYQTVSRVPRETSS